MKKNDLVKKIKGNSWANDFVRRNPYYYGKMTRLIDDLYNSDLEKRKSWAQKKLRESIKIALKTSYGKNASRTQNFSDWPILDKETVKKSPDTFCTSLKYLSIPSYTSGSTGVPLKLYRTLKSISMEQASIDFLIRTANLSPKNIKLAVLRGDTIKDPNDLSPPYWSIGDNGNRILLSSHHLSKQSIGHYISILEEFSPDCIMAYPSSLETLVSLINSLGTKITIPLVITSSETMQAKSRKLAEDVFGCKLIDHYGIGERVAFAYGQEPGKYYFMPSYGYVELEFIEKSGDHDLYEIIGTSLWNHAMVLIRYRTGDLIRCESGLGKNELDKIRFGLRSFLGIEGRTSDYIVSPEGTRLIGMNQIPRDLENILQLQLVQNSKTDVHVLLIPEKSFSQLDEEKTMRNVRSKLPNTMNVTLEKVTKLERTKEGKTPFIIRKL